MHIPQVLRENPNFRALFEDLLATQIEAEELLLGGRLASGRTNPEELRYLRAYTLYCALEDVDLASRADIARGACILECLSIADAERFLGRNGLEVFGLAASDLLAVAERTLPADPVAIVQDSLPAVEKLLIERCKAVVEFYGCSTDAETVQDSSRCAAQMSGLAQAIRKRHKAISQKAIEVQKDFQQVWMLCDEYTNAVCDAIECYFTYLADVEAGQRRERDETLDKYYEAFILNATWKYRTSLLGLLKSFYTDEVIGALRNVRQAYQGRCDERAKQLAELDNRLAQFHFMGSEFAEVARQYAKCVKEIGDAVDQIAEMKGSTRSTKGSDCVAG